MGAYIIAEAGVNHNGRLDLARELCLAAKNAGADCVKFQTWQTEKIITRSVAQADYQADNTGRTESQFDMLKRLELSYDDFRAVKAYCDEIGIQFASTADEADSLDRLRRDRKYPVPALYGQQEKAGAAEHRHEFSG
mgnify:CR=1 FL=1